DLVELLVALALEAEQDDIALALRADVGLDRGQLEVGARRLRNGLVRPVRVELEEVPVGPRVLLSPLDARAAARARATDNGHVLRDRQHRPALWQRLQLLRLAEQLLACVLGAALQLLLGVEEEEGG